MVKIKRPGKTYEYPTKVMELVMIDKKIREDFSKFCKQGKIKKGKLVEEFYKSILLRFHDGTLNRTNGYITIRIINPKA